MVIVGLPLVIQLNIIDAPLTGGRVPTHEAPARGIFIGGFMNMAVFRVHKNENYTVLSNYHFKEKGMSLKAKGLLSLMLSLPENWDYSAAGLVTLSKDGKDSVNAALKELEKFGYLRRTQAYDENGKFGGYNYEIFEQPSDAVIAEARDKRQPKAEKPTTGNPFTENPSTEKPTTENPPQLNNKELNIKKLNTEILSTEEEEERKKAKSANAGSSYDAIINDRIFNEEVKTALYEFIKMRKLIKKPLTDFALTKLINKLEKFSPDPQVQVDILEKSILNNWQDIYAPQEEQPRQPRQQGNVTPLFDTIGEIDADDRLETIKGNVMLSENQIGDLLDKLGLEAFDFYVEKLSNYIKEHGNIKSHYATILRWYKEDSAVAR